MNRYDLQALSRLRLREAKVLLDNNCFEGAYYLAGYAVECALKACIARQIKRYDFPDKKVVTDSYSHDIVRLIQVSGLKPEHDIEMRSNPAFALNWAVVKDWSEQVRYTRSISQVQAQDLYSAITARRNGVIPWLRKWW